VRARVPVPVLAREQVRELEPELEREQIWVPVRVRAPVLAQALGSEMAMALERD